MLCSYNFVFPLSELQEYLPAIQTVEKISKIVPPVQLSAIS